MMVQFKVVRKNKYGHRWIEEPPERVRFRNKCKYQRLGCICDKGYSTYVGHADGSMGILIGCTPDVSCPRLKRWDTMHGLKRPYTIIENISLTPAEAGLKQNIYENKNSNMV